MFVQNFLATSANFVKSYFQIITTFSVVDNMKEQFYAQESKISRYYMKTQFLTCYFSTILMIFPLCKLLSINTWLDAI